MSLIEEAEKRLDLIPDDLKGSNANDLIWLLERLVEALKKKESHTMLGEKDTRRVEEYKDE